MLHRTQGERRRESAVGLRPLTQRACVRCVRRAGCVAVWCRNRPVGIGPQAVTSMRKMEHYVTEVLFSATEPCGMSARTLAVHTDCKLACGWAVVAAIEPCTVRAFRSAVPARVGCLRWRRRVERGA